MRISEAYCTDTGLEKKTNQDSLGIFQAETQNGTIFMAILCDGMGGLEKGEVASANLIRVFDNWFQKSLPMALALQNPLQEVRYQWERLIKTENQNIAEYGTRCGVQLGSTLTVILFLEDGAWLIGHVGDTRVYRIKEQEIGILTQDQTVVANEVRLGRLTPEQAEQDPRKSVLLQCIGASRIVEPDFIEGQADGGECYMLCSDGFRHRISEKEIQEKFIPSCNENEEQMRRHIQQLIEEDKKRGERDNISAILLKVE